MSIATLLIVTDNLYWGSGTGFGDGAGFEISVGVLPWMLSNPCGVGVSSPKEQGYKEQRSV